MKVKILKSSGPLYWYKPLIGQIIEAEKSVDSGYIVRDLSPFNIQGMCGHISSGDVEEVEDTLPENNIISELFEQKVKQIHECIHNERGTTQCEGHQQIV